MLMIRISIIFDVLVLLAFLSSFISTTYLFHILIKLDYPHPMYNITLIHYYQSN